MKFIETQRLTQVWLWSILISILGILLFGAYFQIIEKKEFGNNPVSNSVLITIIILYFLLVFFIYKIKLITYIDQNSIKIKFSPFSCLKEYQWNQISKVSIKEYSPISDFGGYGIRYSSSTKAYIMGGRVGLYIELKSGEKILVGTQDEKKLQEVIGKLMIL